MARQGTVLVIFSHDLLGKGLAARLEGLGVAARAVRSSDAAAAKQALHDQPDVVVLETMDAKCLAGIRRLSPKSRVVDISDSVGPAYPEHALRFDVILDALEDLPG